MGRSVGQRTGCRLLAPCVASLAAAFVVAGQGTAEPFHPTQAAIAGTARPAVRITAVAGVASPTTGWATPTSAPMTATARAEFHRACLTSQLRLSRALSGAAAGTSYTWYTLTSVGPAACSMIGYPGVAILNAHGRVVQHPAVWSTHPGTMPPERVRPVVLTTGQQARFVIASSDITPSPGCRAPYTGKTLQVYPPNQTTAIREPYHRSFCDLVVGPLQRARPHRRTPQ